MHMRINVYTLHMSVYMYVFVPRNAKRADSSITTKSMSTYSECSYNIIYLKMIYIYIYTYKDVCVCIYIYIDIGNSLGPEVVQTHHF